MKIDPTCQTDYSILYHKKRSLVRSTGYMVHVQSITWGMKDKMATRKALHAKWLCTLVNVEVYNGLHWILDTDTLMKHDVMTSSVCIFKNAAANEEKLLYHCSLKVRIETSQVEVS